MAKIEATLPDMRGAANRIKSSADEFRTVAAQVLSSAEALGACWEGDSQVAFMAQQTRANDWYIKMMDTVDQYVATIKVAAADYEDTDEDAAKTIKAK